MTDRAGIEDAVVDPRTLLRVCTSVSNSISFPPSPRNRRVLFARPVLRT
jgi:hypothetical protein